MEIRVTALPRKIIAQALDGLAPMVVLVPLMGDVSRTFNSGVASTRALAAALQAAGAQRLGSLQSAAPRVLAKLDKIAPRLPNVRLSTEEIAVIRAVLELYLGLILQLMAVTDRPRPTTRLLVRHLDVSHWFVIPLSRSHRTRIGVLLPPSLAL